MRAVGYGRVGRQGTYMKVQHQEVRQENGCNFADLPCLYQNSVGARISYVSFLKIWLEATGSDGDENFSFVIGDHNTDIREL